jgi:hypothetical protein
MTPIFRRIAALLAFGRDDVFAVDQDLARHRLIEAHHVL